MVRRFLLAAFVAVVPALASPSRAQDAPKAQPPALNFPVEKYTLPNGLEVLLLEDHTTPVVGVNVWYKVGSKDEKPGRTGFAHLFEHMMFQGSKNHDKEYFAPIEKLGAQINGSTTEDRTNYFETLPSNALELALWLEADRMGFLLPAMTQEKLDNQREVVKNERRQRVDNQPYGLAEEALLEALYPPDHPYHHSVIGSMADLSAASREDVANFFRTYYAPSNASLAVVGDFDRAETKKLIEQYFGSLPKGPAITRPKPNVPTLDAAKHLKMTDRVATARAQLVWPTVPIGADDEAALDMLASVLGGLGKESRLYRTLVYDRQLAASASASHGTQKLAGTFDVVLSARPGKGLDELVELADAEIARMKAEGPTQAEIAKALARTESGLILGLQSITRKADFINQNNVVYGDPLAYKAELAKFYAVTPEDVKRVANKYLTANRVRLDVTPGEQAKRPPEVEVDRKGQVDVAIAPVEVKDSFDRSKMPGTGAAPKFAPPPIVRRTLSNGLKLVIGERHTLPILSMRLIARGGGDLEPKGAEGLASITADLMTEGTATLDSLGLSGALAEIGASLGAGGGREEMSLSLTTLTKNADRALELFADVLLHPAFPEKELERLRALRLAALARRADNAQAIASLVFPKVLYGADHPYGSIETIASVKGLKRDQVVELFGKVFQPNNATLIIVGDTTPDAIVAKLETILKDWKPGDAPQSPAKPEPAPKTTTVYLIDKPGAAQSVLFAGLGGPLRNTPDYMALEVMNSLLGGQFSSRINLNLREDKGYTYGAQTLFLFRQGPGSFIAATSVQTAVTKEALAELVRELKEVASSRPPTEAEVADAKNNLIKGFPGEFETTQGLAGKLAEIVTYNLPDDDFTTYQARVEAITPADAAAVAKKYVNAEGLVIVVVGDRATIEPKLKELPFANTIKVLDPEGNPIENKTETPAAGGTR